MEQETRTNTEGFTRPPTTNFMETPEISEAAVEESINAAEEVKTEKKRSRKKKADKPLTYAERLKTVGVSKEEARKIIDTIAEQGRYVEPIKVSSKLTVDLKTRSAEDIDRVTEVINKLQKDTTVTKLTSEVNKYNLAASLHKYGPDHVFDNETDLDFEHTLKFIKRIPAPIYYALCGELAKFDNKVATIMSEGFAENF